MVAPADDDEEDRGRLELLRYGGSGWWLDRLLPHSPLGLLAAAIALPLLWLGGGYALADDKAAYLATPDVVHQLWFLPLHIVCLRVVGRMWTDNLPGALAGLRLDGTAIRRGAFGNFASVGALVVVAVFIVRDIWFGLTPNDAGLIPFDDPDLWDFAALGRGVHVMMLVLWCLEWALFGYLLWLQIWTIAGWLRGLAKADLAGHLDEVLIRRGYRKSFTLFGRTATLSLAFAIGNLVFIYLTGELIPREAVHIDGVADFLENMSDLLSTALLFVFTLVAVLGFVIVLRRAVMRGVHRVVAAAATIARAEQAQVLQMTGDPRIDVERLRARVEAQGELLHAVALQREADLLGGRAVATVVLKATVPLITTALKLRAMFMG